MGLFSKKKESQQPLDRPPLFNELVAPEAPPKSLYQSQPQQSQQRSALSSLSGSPSVLPDDLSLPSLDEEFKPLKPESFGLPPLGEEKFPESEYKHMADLVGSSGQYAGPLFPEFPEVPQTSADEHAAWSPVLHEQQRRELRGEPLTSFESFTSPLHGEQRTIVMEEDHYMNFQDYMQTRGWLDAIDHNADIGEDTVYRLNELDQEADKLYQKFVAQVEFIQRKIVTVDKVLFRG